MVTELGEKILYRGNETAGNFHVVVLEHRREVQYAYRFPL